MIQSHLHMRNPVFTNTPQTRKKSYAAGTPLSNFQELFKFTPFLANAQLRKNYGRLMTSKANASALMLIIIIIKMLRINLQRCWGKCHHKTTPVCSDPVGTSDHSLAPVTGLLRSDQKEKARLDLCSLPRPQIRENSDKQSSLSPSNPWSVFQRELSSPALKARVIHPTQ